MNTKQLFTTVLALASLSLTACGARSGLEGSLDSSSRETSTDTGTAGAANLAVCNQRSGTDMTAKLKVYQSGNTINNNYIYVRMTNLPTSFKSGSNYIAMWKWLANTSGATYLDSSALNFALIDSTTGKSLTGWVTTLRWSDVKTAAAGLGITDPQTFFNRVNILVNLNDAAGEYDVLKISNYNASTNQAESQLDVLIPMFYANPNNYAIDNGGTRAGVLQNLHPFAAQKAQGWTSAQFQAMSNNYCF